MSDVYPKPGEATTAIGQIIALNERIPSFWQERAGGWAPRKAAGLLEQSRLDWLVSLSHPPAPACRRSRPARRGPAGKTP
jgi:hypothetical protein